MRTARSRTHAPANSRTVYINDMPQPHPTILALGYSEAAMFLRSAEGRRVQAIISIHGPNEYGVESSIQTRLDLEFDDAASPDNPDPVAAYHAREYLRQQRANGRDLHPPSAAHAQAIIDFARRVQSLDGLLLCHCSGGISRSSAAALLCLAAWTHLGDEPAILRHLRTLRPAAQPHPDLIRFGDALLNRQGRLLSSVAAIH